MNAVTILGAGVGFFLYASLFEYAFHRWILHYPWRWLRHPYRVHVFLHHRVFGQGPPDQTRRKEDRDAILFEWWQAPLLLVVHAPLVWAVEWVTELPVFGGGMLALAGYYALYESLHWCMHTPNGRWVERTRVFRWLNAHHRLHHRQARVNFNVVVPLGDVLFGTLQPARPRPTPT